MCRFIGQCGVVMHNNSVGKLVGIVSLATILLAPSAFARRDSDYLIPPPPPTPVLAVPPQPIALPYSEAYANFRSPAAAIPLSQPKALPPQMVRHAPNFTGLSLVTAESRGFGKPRLPYNAGYGPGAAFAMPHTNAPAMNTWFDSSLQWYSNHLNASSYYNSLATQAPYFLPEREPAASAPHPVSHRQRRAKRKVVVASR